MILPGGTIGILGGGQLGRMLSFEARRMGYRVCVLDPDPRCPTAQVADDCVAGALGDAAAALELADRVAVATLDTEHVPAEVLDQIETRVPVRPSAAVLRTIQDRLSQKEFLARHGFPQTKFRSVPDATALPAALEAVGAPAILKSRRAGYDGKGQARVEQGDEPSTTFARAGGGPAVLESFVPFRAEISVLLARGASGDCRVYPVAENVHVRHILHTTRAPARLVPEVAARAVETAHAVADALGHVGMIAVEMFLLDDGGLYVNEIAPRTHNSGHYTYGACATSQFEQHVRAICGLPLGDPTLLSPVVMVNLVGDLWRIGRPDWSTVLADPHARLHLYGKAMAAPGRKMGHILVLDQDTDAAMTRAEAILRKLEDAADLPPEARRTALPGG